LISSIKLLINGNPVEGVSLYDKPIISALDFLIASIIVFIGTAGPKNSVLNPNDSINLKKFRIPAT
jgi:hypothetical protein